LIFIKQGVIGGYMKTYRKTAVLVGVLILTAYGVLASLLFESVVIVVLFESISGAAVIIIAILMFPVLKPWNKKLTISYLVAKAVEGGLIIIAGVLLFSDSAYFLGIRDLINVSHAYFFITASMLMYYLLYQSKIIPQFISVWGMIALISLLIGNLLEITGNTDPMIKLFYPLIMLNELFLAIWLIVKGFNLSFREK
jgi:Domain of unknown function (DUF4386)